MENQAPGPQVLIFLLVFYFLPTILAFFRAHPKLLRIFLFNLFMGYGWGMFGAYYYALSKRTPGLKAFVIFGILSVLMVMIAWPEFTAWPG